MSRGKRRRRPREESGIPETPVDPPASIPRPKQLLILLIFGLGLVALLVGFLVFQGDESPKEGGSSGVPPGFVATIHSPNGSITTVSEAEFEHLVELESGTPLEAIPQRGDERLEDLQATVLSELLEGIWYQEEAAALGVSVSGEEVAAEFAQFKAENYPTETAYQRYLLESGATSEDIERRIRRQLLSARVQEQEVGHTASGKPDYAAAKFGAQFRKKWKSRTQCAPEFLDLAGSGGLLGAGYVVEGHCLGATKGKGALQESIEQAEKAEAE